MMTNANVVNCWNSIGVWGRERPRCPILEQVIHCQNCEKYSAAGRAALDRAIPAEYQHERALMLAEPKTPALGHAVSVIVFRVGDEWFAVASKFVDHIERDRGVHRLPHRAAPTIKGVVNISGEVKLCFSLGALLGIEVSKDAEAANRVAVRRGLVVLKKDGKSYVFPVTEVREMQRVSLDEIQPVPVTVSPEVAGLLIGMFKYDEAPVGYLDADFLVSALERSIR